VPSGRRGPQGAWNTRRLSDAGKVALGDRVREAAAERGVHSQRALIRAASVGNTSIEKLWHGNADPTLSTLLAIVAGLHLGSIEELLAPLGTKVMLEHLTDPTLEETAS
jgi:hypothetical protein